MTSQPVDQLAVATIKGLAIDAIQAANSGHPGMPMGMADAAWTLWSQFLRFDPTAPTWPNRDRFVLSAGHGSMLQYALLHLYGYDLSLEDLKQFRQLHSKTPGHPEYGHTAGVETTTGPLGQGIANGVGMAIAEARLQSQFGAELVNFRTWVIAGDGCMQEGVASEAASLAGHLGLGTLTVIYDSNHITIDGRTELSFSEDVGARFVSYGWHVVRVDGHDRQALAAAYNECIAVSDKPSLVIATTVIGHGSPGKAGSEKVHGAPLGADEIKATKLAIGLDPEVSFAVSADVYAAAQGPNAARKAARLAWETRAQQADGQQLLALLQPVSTAMLDAVQWPTHALGTQLSTRKAGEKVLAAMGEQVPQLFCGSADLGHSTFAVLWGQGYVQKGDFKGRNIHWGIREHAMGAVANGLAVTGGHLAVVSTFLVFHDYMRPAVRLSALMQVPVVYVYTHDSVFVGEDGPTHQPVETVAALRTIPGLVTLRPADLAETTASWRIAAERTRGPTALALTRQNVPELAHQADVFDAVRKGAYVLQEASKPAQLVLIASGSEVHLAVNAAAVLEAEGVATRVVSMPSMELFDSQDKAYRQSVLLPGVPKVSVEAGLTNQWRRYVGEDGGCVGIDTFGASGPDKVLAKYFGLTVDNVVAVAKGVLAG
jgi:transketolase